MCRQRLISANQGSDNGQNARQKNTLPRSLILRISTIMKFGTGARDDPVVKVITGLFRLPFSRKTGPLRYRIVSR